MASVPKKQNNDNETRDFIMNMTPEQWEELGINKPTFWCIQENIRDGKVKLYDKAKSYSIEVSAWHVSLYFILKYL